MGEGSDLHGIFPMMGKTGAKPAAVVNNSSLSQRAAAAELRALIAERFINARNINGLKQIEASALLGYASSAQLNLWESGKRTPPLLEIKRASHVYRVSIDYLMGVSMDPDRDPASEERMQMLRGAQDMVQTITQRIADALIYQTNLGGPSVHAAANIVRGGRRLMEAVKAFQRVNAEELPDLPCGPMMAKAATDFEETLALATELLARNDRINEAAVAGVLKSHRPAENMPLFTSVATTAE